MTIVSIKSLLLAVVTFALTLPIQIPTTAQTPPKPVLAFLGPDYVVVSGKKLTRYYFYIANKDDYPAELFAPSPELPPCGANKKASRTWIDIYDQNGKRLNGFCALTKPADLDQIWFALDQEVIPPSWVYVEFLDRKTNTRYKSNLAETTL